MADSLVGNLEGLAQQRIVQRHGGTITARSVLGRGTTVAIRLPLQQPQLVD